MNSLRVSRLDKNNQALDLVPKVPRRFDSHPSCPPQRRSRGTDRAAVREFQAGARTVVCWLLAITLIGLPMAGLRAFHRPLRSPSLGNPTMSLSGSKRRRPSTNSRGSKAAGSARRKTGGLKDSFLVEAASSEDELESKGGDLQDLLVEGQGRDSRGRSRRGENVDEDDEEDDHEQARETAQQKRVRLAKVYLQKLQLDQKPVEESGGFYSSCIRPG